jgi:FHA domain
MADEKLRLLSLSVRGGPLDGRRHDPDEVVAEILIGSDPDCHLVVDLPGVSPIHARIWADLDESIVYDTHAPAGLWVNDTRIEKQGPLRPGDVLWLGPPGDAPCIECRFAPWVEVLPASLVDTGPQTPVRPQGEPVTPVDVSEALAQAFATPEAGAVFRDEPPAPVPAPAPAPASPAPAAVPAAAPPPTSPEEDPFFVGESEDAGLVPAPAPPAPPVEPPPAVSEPPGAAEAPVLAAPIVADQSLSPEALVAETISDDWAAVQPEPPAPAPRPAPARPVAPPASAEPADDFFIADAGAPAPAVEARPLPVPPRPAPSAPVTVPERPAPGAPPPA